MQDLPLDSLDQHRLGSAVAYMLLLLYMRALLVPLVIHEGIAVELRVAYTFVAIEGHCWCNIST